MRASVVVCVYNRAKEIVRCLESLVALDLDDIEIVVVDDGSRDGTVAAVEEFIGRGKSAEGRIRLVQNERNLGVSGARNVGTRAAKGELILFTDSDCVVGEGWVGAYLAAFDRHPGMGAASGSVREPAPTGLAESAYRGSGAIRRSAAQRRKLMGCNMAFRRDWLVDNPFDEALDYGSDEDEIAWRLERDELSIGFVEEARVHHYHRVDLSGYLIEGYRLGRGSARYGYKRGHGLGHDLWPMTASLLSLPAMLVDLRLGFLSLGLAAVQVAAIVFNEWVLKRKSGWTTARVLPLCCLYYVFKAAGAYGTWLRIAIGGEEAIRRSRSQDRSRTNRRERRSPPVGTAPGIPQGPRHP